jgi:hypothetical protein
MAAFAVVAFVSGGGSSGGGGVGGFNSCITGIRSLVLVRHGRENDVVETIKDRTLGAVVGEVAAGRHPNTLGGAAAGNGRYVMSTATPLGRDAVSIEKCWDGFSPIAPDG